jgi:hypothetical protein
MNLLWLMEAEAVLAALALAVEVAVVVLILVSGYSLLCLVIALLLERATQCLFLDRKLIWLADMMVTGALTMWMFLTLRQ